MKLIENLIQNIYINIYFKKEFCLKHLKEIDNFNIKCLQYTCTLCLNLQQNPT